MVTEGILFSDIFLLSCTERTIKRATIDGRNRSSTGNWKLFKSEMPDPQERAVHPALFFRIVIFLVEIACPLIKTSSEKPDSWAGQPGGQEQGLRVELQMRFHAQSHTRQTNLCERAACVCVFVSALCRPCRSLQVERASVIDAQTEMWRQQQRSNTTTNSAATSAIWQKVAFFENCQQDASASAGISSSVLT